MADNEFSIRLRADGAQQYIREVGEASRITEALRQTLSKPITAKIDAKAGGISSVFKDAEKQATSAGRTIGQAGTTAASQFSKGLTGGLGGITSAFNSSLRGLNGIINGFFLGLGAAAAQAFIGAFRNVGRTIGSQISGALGDSLDFGEQLSKITALTGDRSLTPQLEETIRGLAVNPVLSVGTDEASATVKFLLRTGQDVTAITSGLAEQTVLLQNAVGDTGSLTEYGDAAEIVGRGLAIFGIEAKDAAGFVNGVTGVITGSTISSLNDYQYLLTNSAASVNTLGLSFEDLNALAVSTSKNFSSGRTAATSYSALLSALANPTDDAAAALKAFNIEAFDQKGNFVGIPELQKQLASVNKEYKAGNITQKAYLAGLETIFGSTGIDAAAALAKLSPEEFVATYAKIADVSALERAQIATDNTAAKLKNLGDTAQQQRQRLTDPFVKGLQPAVESATKLLSKLTPDFIILGENIAEAFQPGVDYAIDFLDSLTMMAEEGYSIGDIFRTVVADGIYKAADALGDLVGIDLGKIDLGSIGDLDLGSLFTFNTTAFGQEIGGAINTALGVYRFRIGDLFDFSTGFGSTKLKIGDIIDFSLTPTKTALTVGDLFEYSATEGRRKITIGDFFEFDAVNGKRKITIGDFFEYSSTPQEDGTRQRDLSVGSLDFDLTQISADVQAELTGLRMAFETGGVAGLFSQLSTDITAGLSALRTAFLGTELGGDIVGGITSTFTAIRTEIEKGVLDVQTAYTAGGLSAAFQKIRDDIEAGIKKIFSIGGGGGEQESGVDPTGTPTGTGGTGGIGSFFANVRAQVDAGVLALTSGEGVQIALPALIDPDWSDAAWTVKAVIPTLLPPVFSQAAGWVLAATLPNIDPPDFTTENGWVLTVPALPSISFDGSPGEVAGTLAASAGKFILNAIATGLSSIDFGAILQTGGDIGASIQSNVNDALNFTNGQDLGVGAGNLASAVIGSVIEIVSNGLRPENIARALAGAVEFGFDIGASVTGFVVGFFGTLADNLTTAIGDTSLNDVKVGVNGFVTSLIDAFTSEFGALATEFGEDLKPLLDPIKTTFNGISDAINGFIDAIVAAYNSIPILPDIQRDNGSQGGGNFTGTGDPKDRGVAGGGGGGGGFGGPGDTVPARTYVPPARSVVSATTAPEDAETGLQETVRVSEEASATIISAGVTARDALRAFTNYLVEPFIPKRAAASDLPPEVSNPRLTGENSIPRPDVQTESVYTQLKLLEEAALARTMQLAEAAQAEREKIAALNSTDPGFGDSETLSSPADAPIQGPETRPLAELADPWAKYVAGLASFFAEGPPEEGDTGFPTSFADIQSGLGTGGDTESVSAATAAYAESLTLTTEATTAAGVAAQEQAAVTAETQAGLNAATVVTTESITGITEPATATSLALTGIPEPASLSATALALLPGPVGAVITAIGGFASAVNAAITQIRAAASAAAGAAAAARAASASSGTPTVTPASGIVPGRASGGAASGTVLVGEQGRELFYGGGKAGIVGQNGPEFRSFAAGTTIIPNGKTEQILSRGVRSAADGAGLIGQLMTGGVTSAVGGLEGVGLLIPAITALFPKVQSAYNQFRSRESESIAAEQAALAEQELADDQAVADVQSAATAVAISNAENQIKGSNAISASLDQINSALKRSAVSAEDLAASEAGTYKDKTDEFVRRLAAAAETGGKDFGETLEQAADALLAIDVTPSTDPKTLYQQIADAWDNRSLFAAEQNLALINTEAVAEGSAAAASAATAQAMLDEKIALGTENVAAYLGQFIDTSIGGVAAALGVESDLGSGDGAGAGTGADSGSSTGGAAAVISDAATALAEPLMSLGALISDSIATAFQTLLERVSVTLEPIGSMGSKAGEAAQKLSAFVGAMKSGIEEIRLLLRGAADGGTADGAGTDTGTTPTATSGSGAAGGVAAGNFLVGEQGREIWYNAARGESGIVGQGGPQLANFAPGTKIFSNPETEQILARSGGSNQPIYAAAMFRSAQLGFDPGGPTNQPGGGFSDLINDLVNSQGPTNQPGPNLSDLRDRIDDIVGDATQQQINESGLADSVVNALNEILSGGPASRNRETLEEVYNRLTDVSAPLPPRGAATPTPTPSSPSNNSSSSSSGRSSSRRNTPSVPAPSSSVSSAFSAVQSEASSIVGASGSRNSGSSDGSRNSTQASQANAVRPLISQVQRGQQPSDDIARAFVAQFRGSVSQRQTRIVNNYNVVNNINSNNTTQVDYGGLNVSSIRSSESVSNDFNTLRLLYG